MRTVLGAIFGSGRNVIAETAEVFIPNAEAAERRAHDRLTSALDQLSRESAGQGIWHGFIDGLNRLPRPALALGTIGLFAYAMADPASFTVRMIGLGHVPEPLWWLLGAIVSFYFGARELHYARRGGVAKHAREDVRAAVEAFPEMDALRNSVAPPDTDTPRETKSDNPALDQLRESLADAK